MDITHFQVKLYHSNLLCSTLKQHSGSIPSYAYIAMCDYQESVTTGQTHRETDGQTDAGKCYPYVPLCFAGDTIKCT